MNTKHRIFDKVSERFLNYFIGCVSNGDKYYSLTKVIYDSGKEIIKIKDQTDQLCGFYVVEKNSLYLRNDRLTKLLQSVIHAKIDQDSSKKN